MLVEFSLTCIFYHVWEIFSIYGVHIPRKCIEYMHFYSCLSPQKKVATLMKSDFLQVDFKLKFYQE